MTEPITDFFDSTYLKTSEQQQISEEENIVNITSVINEAIEYKFKLVMIRQQYISLARKLISANESKLLVGTVIDFPFGNSSCRQKLEEIQSAIDLGADEIDIVINYSSFKKSNISEVTEEVIKCTSLCLENGKITKWIVESAALTIDELSSICTLIKNTVIENFGSQKANDVFVKSSTGFFKTTDGSPSGATLEGIKTMIKNSFPLPVKASGGIRNIEDSIRMINLGVKRLGTSSALKILKGLESNSDY
ncbi:MAG: deoxyribose-phosphate aldolase [Flavobacteriales bacterium]|nr:deoxyribose-phosphate aldolase [Flavobacteriales bacterium]MBL6872902.1 deoxyribose-phosphate aldolase [Flavobacteriales bacterium]